MAASIVAADEPRLLLCFAAGYLAADAFTALGVFLMPASIAARTELEQFALNRAVLTVTARPFSPFEGRARWVVIDSAAGLLSGCAFVVALLLR